MTTHEHLTRQFVTAFGDSGKSPFISRAPGRVNLLGEHVDYNGLPVLPMAIERNIAIVARLSDAELVRLINSDSRYAPAEFSNSQNIPPSATGAWENYCKAAIDGLNRHFGLERGPGMELLVSGSIPSAAGLSSSSALVVATALAYLRVLGKSLDAVVPRVELAALLAEAERYTGTQGGGMDQAIILLGEAGSACKIDFFPLRVERVPVFDGYDFVVCNSLVKADKTGSALHRYNEGPLSCRLIRALVEKHAQIMFGDEIEIDRLGDLWFGPLCLTDSEVESLLREAFPRERTTLAEAASLLDIGEAEIRRRWIGDLPEPSGGFPLRARALHQLTEHQRVEHGRDCLLAGDAPAFGAHMNESHRSCAEEYRVSCPELEQLVGLARAAGAVGARLTGAGFGGCTINLVPRDKVASFRDAILERYHREVLRRDLPSPDAEDWVMVVRPGAAAGYDTPS